MCIHATRHTCACLCQHNCHVHTNIHVCILNVHTHMHTPPTPLHLHTCVHTRSIYPHPNSCSTHTATHSAHAYAQNMHVHTHARSNLPTLHWPANTLISVVHILSRESVHGVQVWGVGLLDRRNLTSQLPPCLGLCLCSCSLSPKCGEGAGRAASGRGQTTVALIKNFTPPRGPAPLQSPHVQLGESPKLALFTGCWGFQGPHSGQYPLPAQRAGLQVLCRAFLCLGPTCPSWVLCRGPAGTKWASKTPPQLSFSRPYHWEVLEGLWAPDTSASTCWCS